MAISVQKLHPTIGAEVQGVDLSKPVDSETAAVIRRAFEDHAVLVFRDQQLDEPAQLAAAGLFGKVAMRRRPVSGAGPGGDFDTPFMLVTNIVEDGKPIGSFGDGEMWFHHDTSYYPEPHRATLLYALKLTSWGGETCFSNLYRAYDLIPRSLRDRLEGRKVLQIHDYKRRERLDLEAVDIAKIRHMEQPIFITHPATGRKALYVSRLMSARIEGLSRDESEAALAALFDISEDSSLIYEHHWRIGDLVIWDNWCSIHARKDFPREEPRLMRRLTIEGQAMRF
ncbi:MULTISPECIES: TauD/TfdA family dioxygenase [unclassified Beijerinckia]|uniref:TauD/TfdA dioxygenase family protein n=1 Tax=unclassified Beijerinckia TaxID=2638183 RepID=UPI00089AFEC6|nr:MULTISPECIES: TauD/TfdA family dioxygenase [unclassified Beijerinckia]MDH7796090.1 taurine dioxygenase [Beijerinckia sp. GAS462]SEC29906.1 taurine dioxygenase [Beijerinckia sp. 28-YEA-48]